MGECMDDGQRVTGTLGVTATHRERLGVHSTADLWFLSPEDVHILNDLRTVQVRRLRALLVLRSKKQETRSKKQEARRRAQEAGATYPPRECSCVVLACVRARVRACVCVCVCAAVPHGRDHKTSLYLTQANKELRLAHEEPVNHAVPHGQDNNAI